MFTFQAVISWSNDGGHYVTLADLPLGRVNGFLLVLGTLL